MPTKISQMTQAASLNGTELLPFALSGANYQATLSRLRGTGAVSILDYLPPSEHANILARTSTYDCTAAINNAIASLSSALNATYVQGPKIFFPPGKYFVNSTIDLKASVHFVGMGSGLPFGITSELHWPTAGTNGIVINAYNTANGGTISPATTSAAGTIIEGLRLTSTGSGAVAHGIWVRAAAVIRNCYCESWQGNGIQVVATSGGGGAAEGNASETIIEGTSCYYSGQNGILISGADANICRIIGCDCSNNTLSGFYDHSFLGNTYIGCHAANNLAAPYKTDNTNAQNVFIGCYVEGGQPACSFVSPTLILGGVLSNNGLTNGTWMTGSGSCSGLSFQNGAANVSLTLGSTTNNTADFVTILPAAAGAQPFALRNELGRIYLQRANNGNSLFEFYDAMNATVANGYARNVNSVNTIAPPVGLPCGYLEGIGTSSAKAGMLWRGTTNGAPAAGTNLVGDMTWNSAPVPGGFAGQMCTVAGTPGTWQSFGLINGGGGTITQLTNKSTGVTLNTRRGQITMEATTAIAAGSIASFTLSNTTIGADDNIVVHRKSGGTAGAYRVWCDSTAAGSCVICVENRTAGGLTETPILQFQVLPGATS